MHDATRRRVLQLSGGIALAGMAGCLGDDDDPEIGDDEDDDTDDHDGDEYDDHDDDDDEGTKVGDEAPEVELETPDGESVTIGPIEKPTIVLLVDIHSEYGKKQSRTIADFHEEYGDNAHVLTVNTNLDASMDDLRAFAEEYGGDWDHAMCDEETLATYRPHATVTLCVYDEDGTLVFRHDGEITYESVEAAVDGYLGSN
ncbi:TlpA family protein disulfide reductase [Natronorarus salvus]|uniref:TlpA family protein disulfide reductase n=1 Tax=Natronorarus salvus TaxID=3117733 RepID=UPI002F269B92